MDLVVCVGSSCHLQHSQAIIHNFQDIIEFYSLQDHLTLKGSFCLGHCAETGVCVQFDGQIYGVTPVSADSFFKANVLPACKQAGFFAGKETTT
ncbi:MAG: (2Fe-2S) ferredoxin domain-containing protein [Oscillospiraceae bacterium]